MLEVPQPEDDNSPIIIELDFLGHSVRQLVNVIYNPDVNLKALALGQAVDLLLIADQLSMTEIEHRLRAFLISGVHACEFFSITQDKFWDLLVYASRQDDPNLAKAAIKHLRSTEALEDVLLRPRLDRFDSVTPRYAIALMRSAMKLGPSATWTEIAVDFNVSDAATSQPSRVRKGLPHSDSDSDSDYLSVPPTVGPFRRPHRSRSIRIPPKPRK